MLEYEQSWYSCMQHSIVSESEGVGICLTRGRIVFLSLWFESRRTIQGNPWLTQDGVSGLENVLGLEWAEQGLAS